MAVKDIFKISRKTFFNPLGWLGYNELKVYNQYIWSSIKDITTKPTPQRSETYEEAMARLNVTDQEVQQTGQRYLQYALAFVVLAGIAFAAAFYLLIEHGTFAGLILALASTALLLTQAFRFHFWYFQISQRRLGCTFQEWWQSLSKKESL